MGFRRLIIGIGLLLLAIVLTMAALRGNDPGDLMSSHAPEPEQAPRAPRLPGTPGGWLGVVIAEESVDLAASKEGRVESIRVQVGDQVKQGEIVATMEAQAAQQELAVAEAELLSRRAEQRTAALALEEAQERLKRRETPEQLRTGAVSDEELATARYQERTASAKLEFAQAQVQQHEARVAQLRRNVSETIIRAPFQGVVASRFVTTGAQLQAGQPILHLLRKGRVQVRFAMPAPEARHAVVGQRLLLEASEQEGVLEGHIVRVAPEVDVAAMKVFAVAELESGPGTLLPAGTVMRVRVDSGPAHAGRLPTERNAANTP